MNAQHRLNGERWSATQRLVRAPRMRLNQRHQRATRHDLIHPAEEDLLARLLGQRVEAQLELFHGSHLRRRSQVMPVGLTWVFADLP